MNEYGGGPPGIKHAVLIKLAIAGWSVTDAGQMWGRRMSVLIL